MKRLFKSIFLEYDSRTMSTSTQPPPKLPDTLTPNEIPVSNPHNLSTSYANHFGASATMSDFTLFFMEISQIPGPTGPIHKQELKAAITVPMVSIAGMIQILQQVRDNNSAQLAEIKKQMESGK
jgi:hypothetical protein